MHMSRLAAYVAKLEKPASRNDCAKILAAALQESSSGEIGKVCYLLLGELLPAYRGIEFSMAEKMMIRVLSRAYGKKPEEVAKKYKSLGDLGDTTYELASDKEGSAKKQPGVNDVYEKLFEIAKDSGEESQERKVAELTKLLTELDRLSAKYVARIPMGKLRLGFSEATILDALSIMERGDKSARKEIERAYNVTADVGLIAKKIKSG